MPIDKSIFKSRRFISAVATVIVMVLVAFAPEFEPLESTVVESVTDVVLSLIEAIL
jgi:hypothetical protein